MKKDDRSLLDMMAADGVLKPVFPDEWPDLETHYRALVIHDFLDAEDVEALSAVEYRDRIGEGNLKAYADTLAVGRTHAGKFGRRL